LITEISVPKPDSIFWTFDPQATIISNDEWNPQIKFSEAGTYVVSMTGYFSGCDYSVTKELFVSPFDPNAISNPSVKPITSVVVTPNPSTGEFDVSILLNKKRNLSVVVYDMIGASHYTNSWENVQEVKQRITLNSVSSGIYLLRVITETDAADTRIVINK
jgi:PKD repeat protein